MPQAWITTDDLRIYVVNQKAGDEEILDDAVAGACGRVVELCGPVIRETVSDERARVSGSPEVCLKWRAESIVSLSLFASGLTLTPSDWWVEGQVLSRRDGAQITSDLLISYVSGEINEGEKAPAWARDSALIIAAQYVRGRLARNPADPVPVGFLVPKQADELMAAHLVMGV